MAALLESHAARESCVGKLKSLSHLRLYVQNFIAGRLENAAHALARALVAMKSLQLAQPWIPCISPKRRKQNVLRTRNIP